VACVPVAPIDRLPKEPEDVLQAGALSTLINPVADVPANPEPEVTLTLYGSCAFKKLALGATAVICVASFVGSSASFNASTTTIDSATQITAVAPKASFLNAQEPYKVKFTSVSGLAGSSSTGLINVDTSAVWQTNAGALSGMNIADGNKSVTVSATDADGDTVTYSVLSGSLPNGTSLNSSTGVISGTETGSSATTTYTFTIRATDAEAQTADREFSITISHGLAQGMCFG
jgi:hypothetical protein